MPQDDDGAVVPTGRAARLVRFGGIASGIAGSVAAGGLRALASGKRPDLARLLLTPANTLRLTDGPSHLRGAALKLGQMLSMDTGLMLPDDLTTILGRMRDDARHMPPKQLQTVLNAEWGPGWYSHFARFDVRPFAAASIGQVHRAVTRDGQDLAIKVQYPGVRVSIDSDVDNMATLMRLPGLLPRGMDISPLLAESKRQLHAGADYLAEAQHLARFGALLERSDIFVLPAQGADVIEADMIAQRHLNDIANRCWVPHEFCHTFGVALAAPQVKRPALLEKLVVEGRVGRRIVHQHIGRPQKSRNIRHQARQLGHFGVASVTS